MKRCLVISDSFKGTLSTLEICRIAEGVDLPDWQVDALPVADGGEGTVDCFLTGCGGTYIAAAVSDPFGAKIESGYALLPDGTAVVECAAAAGLTLAAGRLHPLTASTCGVGELMRCALEKDAKRLVLGLGGSCTNDGGCGAAAALGAVFRDRAGRPFVPAGGTLGEIETIDLTGLHPKLREIPLTVMCDIDNPLYGENGAAFVFAPQKGAAPEQVALLDDGLRHLAAVIRRNTGMAVDELSGGGAAGGFGAGCAALLGGQLRSGIETVLDVLDFDRRAADYDLIVTGEGRLDSQSLGGKVVSGVAGHCRKTGVPVAALVGALALEEAALDRLGLACARSINPPDISFEQAALCAADYYRTALTALLEETYGQRH